MRKNETDEVARGVRQAVRRESASSWTRASRFLTKLAGVSDPETQAQAHRRRVRLRASQKRPKKLGDGRIPRSGHDLSRRHRIRPRSSAARHQEPPQRRRSAADVRANFNGGLSSRCACCSRTKCASSARELGLPHDTGLAPAVPRPRPGHPHHGRHHAATSWTPLRESRRDSAARKSRWPALNATINQYFAVLTNTRTVGVMGDEPHATTSCWRIRAVTTDDFMTVDWARLPYDLLAKVSAPHRQRSAAASTASCTISPASPPQRWSGNNPKRSKKLSIVQFLSPSKAK